MQKLSLKLTLKKEIKSMILKDHDLLLDLGKEAGKSPHTIRYWLYNDMDNITQYILLRKIASYFGYQSVDELFN